MGFRLKLRFGRKGVEALVANADKIIASIEVQADQLQEVATAVYNEATDRRAEADALVRQAKAQAEELLVQAKVLIELEKRYSVVSDRFRDLVAP